jgi:methylated-DNA-[protein]-cysteine S-methyltransferase
MDQEKVLLVERVPTPIGALIITHDGDQLCNAEFVDQKVRRAQELAHHLPKARFVNCHKPSPFFAALVDYFDGDIAVIDKLSVARLGTPFQQKAWKALRQIPAGTTRGYGEQAAKLDHPNAARAIGRTNGLNPISIVVPCHRLIGADGSLVHYGGGLERKRWLLQHEARHA